MRWWIPIGALGVVALAIAWVRTSGRDHLPASTGAPPTMTSQPAVDPLPSPPPAVPEEQPKPVVLPQPAPMPSVSAIPSELHPLLTQAHALLQPLCGARSLREVQGIATEALLERARIVQATVYRVQANKVLLEALRALLRDQAWPVAVREVILDVLADTSIPEAQDDVLDAALEGEGELRATAWLAVARHTRVLEGVSRGGDGAVVRHPASSDLHLAARFAEEDLLERLVTSIESDQRQRGEREGVSAVLRNLCFGRVDVGERLLERLALLPQGSAGRYWIARSIHAPYEPSLAPALAEALAAETDPAAQACLARTLAETRSTEHAAPLRALLLVEGRSDLLTALVPYAADLGLTPEDQATLLSRVPSIPDETACRLVFEALAPIAAGAPRVMEAYRLSLADERPRIRQAAVEALAKYPTEAAKQELERRLPLETEQAIRATIEQTLGR